MDVDRKPAIPIQILQEKDSLISSFSPECPSKWESGGEESWDCKGKGLQVMSLQASHQLLSMCTWTTTYPRADTEVVFFRVFPGAVELSFLQTLHGN